MEKMAADITAPPQQRPGGQRSGMMNGAPSGRRKSHIEAAS